LGCGLHEFVILPPRLAACFEHERTAPASWISLADVTTCSCFLRSSGGPLPVGAMQRPGSGSSIRSEQGSFTKIAWFGSVKTVAPLLTQRPESATPPPSAPGLPPAFGGIPPKPGAVRPCRCWLRVRCRCAALLVLVPSSTLTMPNCGAQGAPADRRLGNNALQHATPRRGSAGMPSSRSGYFPLMGKKSRRA
jgi:hypothetical protein